MYGRRLLLAMVQGIVVCDQLHIGHDKAIMGKAWTEVSYSINSTESSRQGKCILQMTAYILQN